MSDNKLKKLMAKGASRIERAKDTEDEPVLVKPEPVIVKAEPVQVQPEHLDADSAKEEAAGTKRADKEPASTIDAHPQEELSAQDKEILAIARRNGFTTDHLRLLERLAHVRNDFPDAIDALGTQGASAVYIIARDDVYIRSAKLKLIALMNLLTRNRLFHTIFRKAGAVIESLRHFKDILFPL